MGRFVARRLIMLIPVLFGVSIIAFMILHLAPGDPAEMLAGVEASQQEIELIRERFGLNQPLHIQYFRFLRGVVTGDMLSLKYEQPVYKIIGPRLKNTLILSVAAMAISIILGVIAGVLAAVYRYSWLDYLATVLALLGISMPVFWWGLLMILVFAVNLMWLPSGGMGGIRNLVLPAIVLGTASMGIITRMTRSSMLDVLRQDYITTARAKGLLEKIVIVRHALRNAMIPTITVIGLQFGGHLAGAVLTESVFSWPGVGRLLVGSILARDYPVVQTTLLIVAAIFVFANLMVDILYAYLDPRIRYHG
ncbi:MAG: ABC transporter permease [Aminobacterium sp.]|jgi:ABC-type dipeptide/oligopeptide/nickel transport system permease component|uniref:ABC transporter permease n=1 Tax=unclassified Aminobacterium TaxID=2685012 RepID=UPI001BCB1DF3|nr:MULTISPECIES: ABC transporter permease [unclassified Aminobacterium]MDD2206065.1 ABC transporter permease [Aminobacterium sp.]MDD3426180.1 ABC transporter permease [Aminobacterium sp.]MDD3707628.1 ABC transporter permease [Aminobacterium sp.]MDD4227778.1 ABC transporter permease [Aminobacterium sp.]MDD4550782.1 ABC transporter permease [Aminobacterium sp.]